jgi:hypothetical protein
MAEQPFINALPNGAEGKQRDGKQPPEAFVPEFSDCGLGTFRGDYNIVSCGPFSGNITLSGSLTAGVAVIAGGQIKSGQMISAPIIKGTTVRDDLGNILANKKNLPFDINHPTKPGWRLRHVCLEGPEIGVYLHGRNKGNVINLPDYWRGLVKQETISVVLTPIGNPYVLYIQKIEDNKVYIGSNTDTIFKDRIDEIEYNYVIHASRYDDDLIVEYEGESHLDYPGNNEGFSFSYEQNYVENLIKEAVKENLESK